MSQASPNPGWLQSYVLPVCIYEPRPDDVFVHTTIGTSFLINRTGYFLTARHVLDQASAAAANAGHRVGLIGKQDEGVSSKSGVAPLIAWQPAPEPFDIAIGKINYSSPTLITLRPFDVEVWQDVGTLGYPISAHGGTPPSFRVNLRALKGYIQRKTHPEDMRIGRHPDGFELSFNVSPGMSGAPVFVHREDMDMLIGVAVSSFRGETTESEISEVDDNGVRFTERRLRIEEYGFAHDIRGLLNWKPSFANGKSLLDLSTE
ncbi:serine protease [Mesorhizobium amorphae]|uniref:S1 family peptidase n=1 Tax=Mesorhizobium amorphae TaxID=71433 RepID=UPI0011832E31|nr:serine protease [Mesorhizobium amorphae]